MKKSYTFKFALCALYSAFGILSFMLENLFPPLFLPGARLGISNVFILLATVTLGYAYGLTVLIVKTLLGSVFSGNASAILYSLPAGLISLSLEALLLTGIEKISVVAISVAGSVVNVTVQNAIFCAVTKTAEVIVYLPYFALIGIIGGAAIGFTVYLIIKKLPQKLLTAEENKQEKKF